MLKRRTYWVGQVETAHGAETARNTSNFVFCNFLQKFKMAAIFGEGKIFWKLPIIHSLDTLWVENFDEIARSRTVKEIQAILCFPIFGKNSKWPPFLGRGKFFWKLTLEHSLDTLWVENFDKIALSHTVKEIQAILCFVIFGENSKWLPFLGRGKFFENWH